jgi:hypothetical protein
MTTTTDYRFPVAAPVAPATPAARALRVDQARFAAGAALTTGVAALTALIGIVVARGILHLAVFGTSALGYTLGVAGAAVAAALLFDAALHIAPHPRAYFGAIVALATALAMAVPFTTAASLGVQAALAVTNLAVGLVVGFLVPLAADSARR